MAIIFFCRLHARRDTIEQTTHIPAGQYNKNNNNNWLGCYNNKASFIFLLCIFCYVVFLVTFVVSKD